MLLNHSQIVILLQILIYTASVCCSPESAKPNIIFILADDLGWNDVGYQGMADIPTPNIDALASHGVVFKNYYSHAMCTPSRAALLTGRYASRLGNNDIVKLENVQSVNLILHAGLQSNVIPSCGPWGLPLNLPTLADKLGDLGYVNRLIGKWHLGFYKSEYLPTNRGFHSHFGFWTSKCDYFDHWEDRDTPRSHVQNIPETVKDESIIFQGHALRCNRDSRKDLSGKYLTDLLTQEAVRVILTHNTTKPLFLFLSHHAPHRGNFVKPMAAPKEYTKHFLYITDQTRRAFAGAMKALDDSIGEVMLALQKKNILDDSMVIFTSDNGADAELKSVNGGSNWPLRGQKFSGWEGGLRLPAIVWSPRLPNPGRIWNGLAHVTDWFPTLLNLAGGNSRDWPDLDGHDLWPALLENTTSTRTDILHYFDPALGQYSLRVGKYKLISGSLSWNNTNGWYRGSTRQEPLLRHRPESTTSKVLHQFHSPNEGTDVRIHLYCGQKPEGSEEECIAEKEVCLFDIEEDPCEYRNLAKRNKMLVQQLLWHLGKYEFKIVPSVRAKMDYFAKPSLYSDIWTPWRDPPGFTLEGVPSCYMPDNVNLKDDSNVKGSSADTVHKVNIFVVIIFFIQFIL